MTRRAIIQNEILSHQGESGGLELIGSWNYARIFP